MVFSRNCHICGNILSGKLEPLFSHCFDCNVKRIEQMTFDFDPCPICNKRTQVK